MVSCRTMFMCLYSKYNKLIPSRIGKFAWCAGQRIPARRRGTTHTAWSLHLPCLPGYAVVGTSGWPLPFACA